MNKCRIKSMAAILLLICFCMMSCVPSKPDIAGADKIEAFREKASEFKSGRYFLTNILGEGSGTGDELEEVFTFRYNDDGTLSYHHEQMRDGVYYAEYSDGSSLYVERGGEVHQVPESDAAYEAYSESDKHPYADGQLLFYVSGYIKDSSETVDENGNFIYIHNYDAEKMNGQLGRNLTGFTTEYVFDSGGEFIYFTQYNSAEEGGVIYDYAYMIEIIGADRMPVIENPYERTTTEN